MSRGQRDRVTVVRPLFQILHCFIFLCMKAHPMEENKDSISHGAAQSSWHSIFTTHCNAAAAAGLCVCVGQKQRDRRRLGRL